MPPLQPKAPLGKHLELAGLRKLPLEVAQASDLTLHAQMTSVEDLSLEELALLAGGLSGYMVSTGYTA
jgi:hypothetical protein